MTTIALLTLLGRKAKALRWNSFAAIRVDDGQCPHISEHLASETVSHNSSDCGACYQDANGTPILSE